MIKSVACIVLALVSLTAPAYAQDNAAALQQQVHRYHEQALQEKLYVHTDKNFYVAGELVWFKIYYVEGTTLMPLDVSKVAYVELLDKDNKPVKQAKIALSKGAGDGSFYLPASVNSGNYTLRAYTNWMKNSGTGSFFEKPVTVVNTLKPLSPPVADTATIYAGFFPEGGNLVTGLRSKVAFQVTDKYGRGLDFSGLLVNDNNDTIASFQPFKFGMGTFYLTPAANQSYKAIITAAGKTIISRLPDVQATGFTMEAVAENAGTLSVTVNGTGQQEVYLLANSRGKVTYAERQVVTGGKAVFNVSGDKLGEGISQLTVFNSSRQPVSERLYFKRPANVLSISAESGSRQYASRKRVQLSIQTKINDAVPADVSVAVYRLDSLQYQDQQNILTYLWLTSELKGQVESPDYYFSGRDAGVETATDNLMLVHGWRRFNWADVMAGPQAFSYVPEFDGHIVQARIVSNAGNTGIPNVKVHLSVPGTQVQFYTSTSDAQGLLSFDVRGYYGQNEIIVQAENYPDSNYHIDILNPFSEKFSNTGLPRFRLSENDQRDLNNYSVAMQVQNTYSGERLSRFAVPDVDTVPFYGKPFSRYMLDDYVRFTTMEEVLREYVPAVAVRRADGQYHLHVLNWEMRQYYKADPLILLDGVYIDNQKIIAYDPLKVKKLEVVTDKYIIGPYVYDGIVNFTTYQGDIEELKLDTKTVRLDYEGLQMKREFYSPVYDTDQQAASHMPDFRNLLFWSPGIQTDNKGNATAGFYTSDIKGSYIAVLQGMDAQGHAGHYYFTFEVK